VGAALVRQWLILSLLPRPPQKIDAATIESRLRERGHAIHRRTIQRDLVELASVFPIVADERSKPYGWRWSDAGHLRFPSASSHDGPHLRVELSIRASLASEVADLLHLARPAARTMGALTIVVRGDVEDTPRTRRVLLAYGADVEVVAPRALRAEMRASALRIAERHEPP
jgi:predicted DNA-binding transcriptional regulator YafY